MKTYISFSFLLLWLSGILYSQQVAITFPILTGDYFMRAHNSYDNLSTNIWWIDAKIIEELKNMK